jgi:hypothetical protein
VGGEVVWFASSSTCSTKEVFGICDDEEEEKKRVIEHEGAGRGDTGGESCGAK